MGEFSCFYSKHRLFVCRLQIHVRATQKSPIDANESMVRKQIANATIKRSLSLLKINLSEEYAS